MRKSPARLRNRSEQQRSLETFINDPDRRPDMATSRPSENLLKFICELQPEPGAVQMFKGDDQSLSVDYESVSVVIPAQCSVHQLRLRICAQAQEQNCLTDPFAILDPKKYALLYARDDDLYEAYDDCQVLRTLDIPWSKEDSCCLSAYILVKPMVVVVDTEEMKRQQQSLTYLVGHDLEEDATDRLDELTFTRRKLASLRRQELRNRDDVQYTTDPWVTSAPITDELQEWLNRRLPVTFHYMSKISFSVEVDINATPEVLLQVFVKVIEDQGLECDTSKDLVLKVTGREEYFTGNHTLINFLWVRRCLITNQELHLSVLPVSHVVPETVQFVDWPLVDGFSGKFSSHNDLTLQEKDLDDIFMISLWDCNRKFRVKLLGFDIPEMPNKSQQMVYVEASLLYGNKSMFSVSSSAKLLADEVLWNEWLDFDVLLSDLPRGVKLSLTINAKDSDTTSAAKEQKQSSTNKASESLKIKGNVLFFVSLLLIDHRSVLSQGPFTLHMWPYLHKEHDQADRLSSATNPDKANSMAISILLDRYRFPVVLPNAFSDNAPSSSASLFLPSSSNTDPLSPDESIPQFTDSPTLRSPTSVASCRRRSFKMGSVQYSSSFPQFLRKVEWMNRKAVEDVHWLLENWDPLEVDLPVALELLSMDFVDEVVRRLAVKRLEALSNDDLLMYLLQLVQTLKVEPFHDSFLARYLIQRALRSKRIGHFFFWFVRSEVVSGQYFRERMAVILEAYLLGCGAAMINSFIQQVQAVEALQEVAIRIKNLYPDKTNLDSTTPLKLQELLRNSNLPNEFVLPFDPRVKAGKILLENCKVMASKKKPLWLEFSPMPSPISSSPVGIIFKEGDDLRQDMLVIQTLVIMDSIWQEKSLDLNLIPYGCIATGHNIGMIEIVRNAVTLAAIQKSFGGSAGAFKNNALFEWLKSKCPLQEIHYKTVERFVKSCAGYCVAMYVLGIGDRHNDNIMITDQGNLFHIDFGHILGNRKQFLGMKRERVPFVLTPDFLYVMGRVKSHNSLYFQKFVDTCIQAYLLLRPHSQLLVTLFSLMLLTGIPELSTSEDMRYLKEVLQQEQTDAEAKEHFLQQISECQKQGWTVQTNWWIHMVAGIR
ncbi:phosphatidylinositol 4,5-bisphosphate 3-kinase catalytic subunit gamma isoform [Oryzias latipes]|uniref:Phosphatidylinositol 4,5-bisphosphate 3-kinase catalytic subunit gamma isoform n=1 Tax=Oryzias latipes TaxID=8090 RepID=H2L8L2_ORYLA|nr:phosphatidylinositol 4,5-bisphosphate 3-kinase catalytic subunit gamma isoform [Oryzias latipes]